MNTKQLIGALALAATGITTTAHAESYDGVLITRSERPRSELAVEAREAALKPIAGEAALADKVSVSVGQFARADIRRDAVSAARAGNPHGDHAGAGVLSVRGGATAHDVVHDTAGSQAREIPRMPRRQAAGG